LFAYDKIVRAETMVSMQERWLVYMVYEDTGERQDGGPRDAQVHFAWGTTR
jgi:hypothetical protein